MAVQRIKLKNKKQQVVCKYTGNFCKKLKFLDTQIVSTDHKLIAKEAIKDLPVFKIKN